MGALSSRPLSALAAAALTGAALSLPAGGAGRPSTGDPNAINYFDQALSTYTDIPGAKMVETGYFFGIPSGPGAVKFMWANPPPPGFQPQTATIYMQLSGGKIIAYLANLTGRSLTRVRLLMDRGHVFISTGKCWNRVPASSSPSVLGTGDRYLLNGGGAHFLPLQVSAGSTSTTFTYAWRAGSQARETDTFGPGPTPSVHVTIRVTGSTKMFITRTIQPLRSAPPLPVPAPPAPPVPKPLCAG